MNDKGLSWFVRVVYKSSVMLLYGDVGGLFEGSDGGRGVQSGGKVAMYGC